MNIDDNIKTLWLEGRNIIEIEKITNVNHETVRQILIRSNVHVPKKAVKHNYTNLDFFQTIDTEEKAYWLGFIYADGCISYIGYRLEISINKKDEEHLQKLSDMLNKPLRSFTQTCSLMNDTNVCEMVKLYVYNKSMYNDLLECGVEERKTYSDTTRILDSVPKNLIHHFVRGYFDQHRFPFMLNRSLQRQVVNAHLLLRHLVNQEDQQDYYQYADHGPKPHPATRRSPQIFHPGTKMVILQAIETCDPERLCSCL